MAVKALVTGHLGFIGRRVHDTLERAGYDVFGIDVIHGEQDDARLYFRHASQRYDVVVNCAAVVGGRALIEDSAMAHAANLEIDAALFQWAERTRPGRVVYVSSVAAYPAFLQSAEARVLHGEDVRKLSEADIELGNIRLPDQLYGWAKLTGEILAARSSIPVSIPRPFTVYGEDQEPAYPFGNLAAQVRERRDPVTIWGSGNQVRDFIHADDVAGAILAMAEQGIDGPVNLCSGRPVSLRDLAGMMAAEAGYSPDIKTLPDKPEGLPYRVGNPRGLHGFYTPRISLEEGVRRALRGPG